MPSKKSVGVPMGTRAVAGHPAGPPHPRGYPATRPGVCDPDPTPIPPDQGPAARVPSTRGRSPGVVPDPAVVAGRGASSLLPLERMRPAGRASPAAVTAHPRRTGRPYPIRRRPERSPTMRRARGVAPDPGHLRAPGPAAPVHAPAAGSSLTPAARGRHTPTRRRHNARHNATSPARLRAPGPLPVTPHPPPAAGHARGIPRHTRRPRGAADRTRTPRPPRSPDTYRSARRAIVGARFFAHVPQLEHPRDSTRPRVRP